MNSLELLVGILSILVTVLVGWNIMNVLDLKEYKERYKEDSNYIHNKVDYFNAINKADLVCVLAELVNEKDVKARVRLMMMNMFRTVKVLSNFPDAKIECDAVLNIVYETLIQREFPCVSKNDACHFLEMLGEINNRKNSEGIKHIRDYLLRCIEVHEA